MRQTRMSWSPCQSLVWASTQGGWEPIHLPVGNAIPQRKLLLWDSATWPFEGWECWNGSRPLPETSQGWSKRPREAWSLFSRASLTHQWPSAGLDLPSLLNSCAVTAGEAPWYVAFLLLPVPGAGHRERALLMEDHNWVPGGSHVPSLGCPAPPDTPGVVASILSRGVLQINRLIKHYWQKKKKGNSLVVQYLKDCFHCQGCGSVSSWRTKIRRTTWHSPNNTNTNNKALFTFKGSYGCYYY